MSLLVFAKCRVADIYGKLSVGLHVGEYLEPSSDTIVLHEDILSRKDIALMEYLMTEVTPSSRSFVHICFLSAALWHT